MGKSAKIAFLAGGVLWLTLLVGLLVSARRWALSDMNTHQAQADWTDWRDEVRGQEQSETPAPVHRRIPKSSEPPVLLLMRDYFGVCLIGTIVFGAVLYAVLAFLFHGAMRKR